MAQPEAFLAVLRVRPCPRLRQESRELPFKTSCQHIQVCQVNFGSVVGGFALAWARDGRVGGGAVPCGCS